MSRFIKWFEDTSPSGNHPLPSLTRAGIAHLWVHWIIEKASFMCKAQGQINERQEKVLHRLFRAGPEGFTGGLSAKNHMRVTGTTIANTTRDLRDLVKKNLLSKTGERNQPVTI